MNNKDIRQKIKKSKLFQWQVAEHIGISESSFSRRLRHELPESEKQNIYDIVQKLKEKE